MMCNGNMQSHFSFSLCLYILFPQKSRLMELQEFQHKAGFSAVRNNSVTDSSVAHLMRMALELYHRLEEATT